MKLKIGNKVYLQKYEARYIVDGSNCLPCDIINETFSGSKDNFLFISSSADSLHFERVYKKPENVKWLMDQDWIVDYDEYAKMPLAELEALRERLDTERFAGIREFNAKDEVYRKAHFGEESEKFERLGHKIVSLEKFIRFRKGEIGFVFPEEYQKEANASDISGSTSALQKKFGFLARLFGLSTH